MTNIRLSILFLALGGSTLWGQNYTGSVTEIGCSGIGGTAKDLNNLNASVSVDIYDGTVYLTTVSTYVPSNWSFDLYQMPAALMDNQVHTITVRYAGTTTSLPIGNSSTQFSGTLQCAPTSTGYQYYHAENLQTIGATNWYENSVSSSNGIAYQGLVIGTGHSGSIISKLAVQSPNTSNYEVNSTLTLQATGGAYVQYLRATSNAVSNGATGQGSYLAVEVQNPQFNAGACSANLVAYQNAGSGPTPLMSAPVACYNGMQIRTVVFGSTANIMVNGVVYSVNNIAACAPTSACAPGVGGRGMPTGDSISQVELGPWDNVAPGAVNQNTFTTTVYFSGAPNTPGNVMATWQGALDNPNNGNGVGIAYYEIARTTYFGTDPNTPSFLSYDASFYDGTVLQQNTYNYSVTPYDFHGNAGPASTFLASTGQGTVDGHRIGQRTTGSYWGGAGEQIDLLSGNLNYTLPLMTAIGRAGLKATFALAYNSQNWRVVLGVPRILGADTGFGFGWQLMLGSLMPVYTGNGNVAYYFFTDSTGAQYHLTQNNGGIWSATESLYVWYDANANRLHFRNGNFWVMGCVSAGGEQDAGTLYPTIVEDTNGNQIIISYMPGSGVSWSNSSSRIYLIEDARAQTIQQGGQLFRASYSLAYSQGTSTSPPYLYEITNSVGTSESYHITVNPGLTLNSPNGLNFGTAGMLASVTSLDLGYSWNFTYDTVTNDGDLTEVQFPQGGNLSWTYNAFTYLGQRNIWQVTDRYLTSSAQQQSAYHYTLATPDNPNTVALHTGLALDDIASGTEKYWSFNPTGAAYAGLVSELQYRSGPGVTTPLPRDETYAWSQDANGNAYVGTVTTTLDQGTSSTRTTQTAQTQDGYGNVLTTNIYDYGNQSTPARSYTNAYQYQNPASGQYYSLSYMYDRLWTSTLTSVSPQVPLVSNSYDTRSVSAINGVPFEQDWVNYGSGQTIRGNVTQSTSPGRTINTYYDMTGTVTSQDDNNGHYVSVATSVKTNFTLPDTLTPNGTTSLQTQAAYNPTSLAPASIAAPGQTLYDPSTSPSGTAAYTSYDTDGRVAYTLAPSQTWGSATGAKTSYAYGYNTSTGWTITATTTNTGGTTHFTTNTLDGLGRTTSVQTGTGATALSEVDTLYAPCACSPLGKMYQQSQPYAPPNSAPPATTYTFDALGRTTNVLLPDGASHTTYVYQGNFTTVTDPAGNWKQYASDAFGNLTMVLEPDPTQIPMVGPPTPSTYPVTAAPAGMLLTTYIYDQLNHLTQVSMPRTTANGLVTQTRTFVYDPTTQRLSSVTNPENGTVSYTYNADGTLATKKDANGNTESYNYDANQRLIAIPDRQQTFAYDTCPANATGCVNAPGQLMQSTFGSGIGANQLNFAYNYAYTPAGKVSAKTLEVQSANHLSMWQVQAYGALTASYTYDSQGALIAVTYPQCATWTNCPPPTAFTITLDAMERPTGMTDQTNKTWASGVTYNAANQPLYDGTATRTYNSLFQVTSISGTGMNMTYNYSATQNNGQITSSVDTVTGETITYQYDALKRLLSASGAAWSEGYVYDGYGNLIQMNPSGLAPRLGLTVALDANNVPTNRINAAGVSYDSNGNQTAGFAGLTMTYDAANRIIAVGGSQSAAYAYDTSNQRVYSRNASGAETIYFYGADGRKLATYTYAVITYNGNPEIQLTQQSANVYFLGKLISAEGNTVQTDRLGSVRNGGPGNLGYQAQYPYGIEYSPQTVNDREKYATYTRDIVTGLDYAMNRYYASQWGRFLSPDPYLANTGGAGDPENPQSWNRYGYAQGDPVNGNDARGLFVCVVGVGEGSELTDCEIDTEPVPGGPEPGPTPSGASRFPLCESAGSQTKLAFLADNYAAASKEAAAIQEEMPSIEGISIQANQANLTSAFLDWSAFESGYGRSSFAKSNNNYFGYGNVSFPSSMTWGAELASILAYVPHTPSDPNPGNAEYSSFLVESFINNPNSSPAAILQSIANAGYNTNPKYGNDIAGSAKSSVDPEIQKMLDCLKKNKYI